LGRSCGVHGTLRDVELDHLRLAMMTNKTADAGKQTAQASLANKQKQRSALWSRAHRRQDAERLDALGLVLDATTLCHMGESTAHAIRRAFRIRGIDAGARLVQFRRRSLAKMLEAAQPSRRRRRPRRN